MKSGLLRILLTKNGETMNKYCIGLDYTIKEAIERIDASKNRAVIVIDKEDKVVGVVSQGDIIRALCSGNNLYTHIDSIIKPNFFYLNNKNLDEAYRLFRKIKISLMPVIDENFKLTDVINLDDIYDYLEGK